MPWTTTGHPITPSIIAMGSCCDYLITSAVVKNLSVSAEDALVVSIPGSQRFFGVGSGNTLQYSYLGKKSWPSEEPHGIVHGIMKSWT